MLDVDIDSFIKQHQLPPTYQQLNQQWFSVLASKILLHQNSAEKPIVVGINGAQGSGKSTLAALLCFILNKQLKVNAISLSLDDFYLTRAQRQTLAKKIHQLLSTRGVPGTHDVALAIDTITNLLSQQLPVEIPCFNKAIDDRASEGKHIAAPVDIIIFEGWCLGAEAEDKMQLATAVNDLEADEDQEQVWRRYANTQLSDYYPALFNLIDTWIMLKAPSFDCVYQWRLEQENKLREKSTVKQHIMDSQQLARFIQFYERITKNILKTLPDKVDYLYILNERRQITKMLTPSSAKQAKKWLVFTDMDGSLLDHYTYQFDEAILTLTKLRQHNIPVIPITSKTQAELEFLRLSLDNLHPFIIENGAAVFIPKRYFDQQPKGTVEQGNYWVKSFVKSRQHWQQLITEVGKQHQGQFKTFSELGIKGIMEMTGLDPESASRAAQRQYGEPLAWLGNDKDKLEFIAKLTELGANILEGGRFIHVSGNSDKGLALTWLSKIYQTLTNKTIYTLALGDSQNDIAMLEVADYAVVIRSPVHAPPEIIRNKQQFISTQTGPLGWVEGIHEFIFKNLSG